MLFSARKVGDGYCHACGHKMQASEVERMKDVIREVFCLDLSNGKPGTPDCDLDIIGASLVPWSKECRLTVVEILRPATAS